VRSEKVAHGGEKNKKKGGICTTNKGYRAAAALLELFVALFPVLFATTIHQIPPS